MKGPRTIPLAKANSNLNQIKDLRTGARASIGTAYRQSVHRKRVDPYVSPAQRHAGEDVAILTARHEVYLQARERNPARWSGNTRDWSHIATVSLNPERDSIVAAASRRENIQPLAA